MDTGIASNRFVLATLLLVAVALTGAPGTTHAAPGQIADSPLFLTTSVQPNIFFMVDDSGSMAWDILPSAGARNDPNYCDPNSNSSCRYIDFTPNTTTAQLELCHGYNVMAYNPNATYTPWKGVDNAGNPYPNMTLTSARTNPYVPSGTTDLSNQFYFPWNDSNSDGLYQSGECPTLPAPPTVTATDCTNNPSTCVDVSTLTAAQQTNYANWYSYYRKREYVVKRALSEIISDSTSRMGISSIHNNNNIGTPIKDIDDITTPVDATAQANKAALLDNLFHINSSGGTPLRIGLLNVGKYYAGDSGTYLNSLFGTTPNPISPILPAAQGGACQQNFTVLMSDGFWNGSSPGVGNTDGDNDTAWDGASYADSYSNTLADVAMKYYETDLSALADEVPVIANIDNNPAQHMVTYTVAFGVNGQLTGNPPNKTDPFTWPQPVADTVTTVDDMRHAAWNGRGQFLSAADPQALINSLSGAIADIQTRTGSAAAVSFNSTSLQTNSLVYQAKFDSANWSGNLRALDIDPTTGVGAEAWNAASLLDTRDLTTNPRQIVTYNGSTGILFKWPAAYTSPTTGELTSAQIADLLADGPFPVSTTTTTEIAANQAYGQKIADFLRGSHADEGTGAGQFRDRHGHRLGDIVHSSPVYVGVPDTPYPDTIEGTGNLYSTFATAQANRPGMVYVGANDGMLHVFDSSVDANGNPSANAGKEVFAYIPSMLFSAGSGSGLHRLAEQTYTHKYYVDLSATAADVFVGGAWKTMLVGGLRGGGKGVFALDITNPSAFSTNPTSVPKWEFTNDNLGYTFSDIRIARMNNGKWAAIFGNGYNSDPNGDGKAKLFILYLDGSNLSSPIILDTGAGSITNGSCSDPASDCNGLSTPAIADLNGDGNIDRIYAGDLQGHMWVFNVQDPSSANWKSAYSTTVGTVTTPEPLFTACAATPCTAANRQPITSKPALARHPTQTASATAPNLMVFFGTGQYLAAGDNSTTGTQSFYGVWDSGTKELDRDNLVAQTITTATYTTANDVRLVSDNPVDYVGTSPKYGWLIDLPTSKERVVTDPVAVGDLVFFNTMIPSSDICSYGGTGWLMSVKQINGGEPAFPPVDLNNDGTFDASDQVSGHSVAGTQTGGIPTGSRFISNRRVTTDSTGAIGMQSVQTLPPQPSARMSWTDLER